MKNKAGLVSAVIVTLSLLTNCVLNNRPHADGDSSAKAGSAASASASGVSETERYYTSRIDKNELATMIADAFRKHQWYDGQMDGKAYPADILENAYAIPFESLTVKVAGDISVVGFEPENRILLEGPAERGCHGFHAVDGLTYFGISEGGDWEKPVFLIVYYDGSQLRGYVPRAGNPWNTRASQAYGSELEDDLANAVIRGFISPSKAATAKTLDIMDTLIQSINPDCRLINGDIGAVIKYNGD